MSELFFKASRFISRGVSKSILPDVNETIVSFGFDDCPSSAIETALPMLEAEGWHSTIYVACGLCETENHLGRHMSLADIVDAHERGHEIADHTYSHVSPDDVSITKYVEDIDRNQKTLTELGLPLSRHFAYPYGHVSPALKKVLKSKFETLRGVKSPKSTKQDANLLNAARVYSGERLQAALEMIEKSKTTPQWLNLFTHDVRESPSDFGCTPEEFETIVTAVKKAGLRVMTVDDAYRAIDKRLQTS